MNEAFDCDFVNLSTSRSMEEIGKGGIKKLFRFVAAYFEVLWKLITHRYSLCYLAITCHGMGFLKDAPFVLLCKLFGRKVVLHQHNKGMSRDVNRWPYRWLMPLVYRNTTVMLLSWHLYEDISAVVKREQVVVCANGVPPLDNGQTKFAGRREKQQSTDNGLLRDQDTQSVYDNVNENEDEFTIHNSQFTIGRPDGTLNSNPLTLNEDEKTAALYEDDNCKKQKARLLFLSNLIESKGVYVLLDACKVLKERGLQFACDFVGGETKEIDRVRFETAIKERGLEGVVCYQGPKYGDEKERYLAMADVLVFPTYYYNECFPLVILEAMQHKLAVVSTTEGAIPDVVSNGVNGFVVERKNAVALADALEQLIANMELCHQMGEQGYARYKEHYTLEVFEKRFTALLLKITDNRLWTTDNGQQTTDGHPDGSHV